jgi:hypothetical protein
MLLVDMFKATKVDIKLIEPEVTYKAGVGVMMRRAPSYWSRLGSSKNRTAEQTEESKEVVKDLIGDPTDNTIVAFTDDSCQGNPEDRVVRILNLINVPIFSLMS